MAALELFRNSHKQNYIRQTLGIALLVAFPTGLSLLTSTWELHATYVRLVNILVAMSYQK